MTKAGLQLSWKQVLCRSGRKSIPKRAAGISHLLGLVQVAFQAIISAVLIRFAIVSESCGSPTSLEEGSELRPLQEQHPKQ